VVADGMDHPGDAARETIQAVEATFEQVPIGHQRAGDAADLRRDAERRDPQVRDGAQHADRRARDPRRPAPLKHPLPDAGEGDLFSPVALQAVFPGALPDVSSRVLRILSSIGWGVAYRAGPTLFHA